MLIPALLLWSIVATFVLVFCAVGWLKSYNSADYWCEQYNRVGSKMLKTREKVDAIRKIVNKEDGGAKEAT